MSEQHIKDTSSLCAICYQSIPASLFRIENEIIMRKACSTHGQNEILISSNAAWYDHVMSFEPVLNKPMALKQVSQGCPFDCGACTQHEQRVHLPIIPITSSCNLDCPICYTHNKNDGPYQMTEDELRSILNHLHAAMPEKRIINITGGEPTQHPQFERLIELCFEEGIHRITISTHGLRFLKDEKLLERLAKIDARIVLSFDSFRKEVNQEMLGGRLLESKMKVLDLLEKYNVNTTLLPVLARGRNDDEVGKFIDLSLYRDFIRSIELHTMTFTGQNGSQFDRSARYNTYDVLCDIENQTNGRLKISDFVPSPAAHSLCYMVTYMLQLIDGRWLPYTRFMSQEKMRRLLGGCLYLEPSTELEQHFQEVIHQIWSGEITCEEPEIILASLKAILNRIFSPKLTAKERLLEAEKSSKAIYIHSHMDEENFDTDRIKQCCIGIREADGTQIPSCAYNVLYRSRDHRFSLKPADPISTLGIGRI